MRDMKGKARRLRRSRLDAGRKSGAGAFGEAVAGISDIGMAMSVRPVWGVLGLLLLTGCGADRVFGPLEIEVEPLDLTRRLPQMGVTHTAYINNYGKLFDECGSGIEAVQETYERRVAKLLGPDETGEVVHGEEAYGKGTYREQVYQEMVNPMIQEAVAQCMDRRPALVPKECKRRMIVIENRRYKGGDAVLDLQCGESAILPLEINIEELFVADVAMPPRIGITHIAQYSNWEKLLDECGPGAHRTLVIAYYWPGDDIWHTFRRMVEDALVECLEKRNLVPPECRHGLIPITYDEPIKNFISRQVGFRCDGFAGKASSE